MIQKTAPVTDHGMGRRQVWLLLLVLALALPPAAAWADIYTFTDQNGTVHFTNVPNDPRFRTKITESRFRRPTGSVIARRSTPGDPKLYEQHIQRAASHYAMDPLLIKAVIKTESDFDCHAVSPKGAKGLMQLMPGTAADLNVWNPFDPQENIYGGTNYLRQMLARFGGNLPLALAAYNAGPARVEASRGIPQIPETQQYVKRVIHHYRQMSATHQPSYSWLRAAN